MPKHIGKMTFYNVKYGISKKGYKGGTQRCAIEEGYSTVNDFAKMIAMRRGVSEEDILIYEYREVK